ncbi:MAG: hypothetical protein Q4F25_00605 [Eubacteriales bacterium]|nr:hypothetical protein [Eubacteriales bacterium]
MARDNDSHPVRNLGVAALILLLLGGGAGIGLGSGLLPGQGNGLLPGQSSQNTQEGAEQAAEESAQTDGETQEADNEKPAETTQETEAAGDMQEEAVPDVIVVRIQENTVTINGHEVRDKEELRQYVEKYNSDARSFTLEEEKSILETYNWVKEVFDDLDVQLRNSR